MAASYLGIVNGRRVELLAGTTGGATDANKILALDASGKIPAASLPNGVMADADTFISSEAIASGAWVNIFSNAGVPTVRNAVATGVGTEAFGYVIAGVGSGQTATVYFDDNNTGVTGLTIGRQYLSATTPGASTTTSPTGANVISQYLGFAVSSTIVHAAIEPATILAQ